MNARVILYVLSKISCGLAFVQLLPLLLAFIYGESCTTAFMLSIGVGIVLAGIFEYYGDADSCHNLSVREGIGAIFFSWLMAAAISALPFYFEGILDPVSAFFEAMSGLTTTGATAIDDLDRVARSLLLWRTLMQWLGGIGIIILFVALLPQIVGGAVYLFSAELSGMSNSRILPRIRTTAVALFYIYLLLTIILTGILNILGMSTYDAINYACSAIATGGFSTHNTSVAYFHNAGIEIALSFFMVLSAGNFALYYQVTQSSIRVLWQDLEFKCYIVMLALLTLFISLNLVSTGAYGPADGLREAFFQVAAFGSTTGFVAADYDKWPTFSKLLLATTFLTGGCAGSTAGGIKMCRFIVLLKAVMGELRRTMHPQMLLNVYYSKRLLPTETIINISRFFFVYIVMIALLSMLLALDGLDVDEAIFGVASCMASVGPAFGSIGANSTYAAVGSLSKLALALAMLLGRLELFTVLALLRSEYWRNSKRW